MYALAPLCICALTLSPLVNAPDHGHLWQPAFCIDTVRRSPREGFVPQPGDLVLMNAGEKIWKAAYRLALSGPPSHSSVVCRLPDGSFGLLEGGIGFSLKVELSPLVQRLPEYFGDIYIRRRKTPLTREESDRLTAFALAAHKERVTALRLPLQVTPFRSRGPWRIEHLAKPRGIGNHTWTCSELVVEAYVAAGLLDACTARPAATYPRDFFFDHSTNPFLDRHLSPQIAAGWHPPRLWTKTSD